MGGEAFLTGVDFAMHVFRGKGVQLIFSGVDENGVPVRVDIVEGIAEMRPLIDRMSAALAAYEPEEQEPDDDEEHVEIVWDDDDDWDDDDYDDDEAAVPEPVQGSAIDGLEVPREEYDRRVRVRAKLRAIYAQADLDLRGSAIGDDDAPDDRREGK